MVTDQNGNQTEMVYDHDGNLVKEIQRASTGDAVTEYEYDLAGKCKAVTDAGGLIAET